MSPPISGKAVGFAGGFDAVDEPGLPIAVARQGQRQQGRGGRRAFGREVRQVHCDQLPADARGRIEREEVHALGDAVVGDDQPVEQRRIVNEAARRGVGRDAPQPGDDLAHSRITPPARGPRFFGDASRMPLTKPLSRLS